MFSSESGNNEYVCHFLTDMAPNHLGLVVFHLHRAFHPTTTSAGTPIRMSEFRRVSLKPASAFRALNKLQGHSLLLLSFLQRDREKYICYFRREAHGNSTHTIRTAGAGPSNSAAIKRREGKERENPHLIISAPVSEEGACC